MRKRIFYLSGLFASALFVISGAAAEIRTIAGTGEKGYSGSNGSALEAHLDNPFGVIVGLDGDIYFCDTGNHVIRRISRKGKVTTIAGTGKAGYSGDGGKATEAELFEPYEVRFHPNGDLYWVEMKNHIIRKMDARTNLISTVAGTGKEGFSGDGGPAVKAQLHRPHSIQFDRAGENLFVCDIQNHRIRKINLESGVMVTWCGNGEKGKTKDGALVSADTPLNGPRALDLAPNGDLWLALREGNVVFRIDMENETLHHVAGTGKKGLDKEVTPALEASLSGPKGVAISPDGKHVYLADTESHTVRAIDLSSSDPVVRLIAGTGAKGDGPDSPDPLACKMARLHGVGTDPVNGDVYIGDSEAHKVRVIKGLPGGAVRKSLGAYKTETLEVAGKACKVTIPEKAAAGNPWIWRCRFYGAFPSVDEALLAEGWHIAWIDVGNLFGAPAAMEIFDEFYGVVREKFHLAEKPIMEGFSRGGLPAANWAIQNPEKVKGLYLDAAVMDIHTWPKRSSKELYEICLKEYGLTEETASSWKGPLTRAKTLVDAGVPLMIVAGGADPVVPYLENSGILEKHYRELGGDVTAIVKAACEHHPHSLRDPAPVVKWALGLK